jgi:hypothetical protein
VYLKRIQRGASSESHGVNAGLGMRLDAIDPRITYAVAKLHNKENINEANSLRMTDDSTCSF